MTVIIPYIGEGVALSQLLVSLQPQLHPDDDIYILDGSADKSAKEIVLRYGSTRCYIMVELTKGITPEAIQYGFQSMRENKQDGALIILPQCVISTTFVANLKKAMKQGWDILVPQTSVHPHLDDNFGWFCPPTVGVKNLTEEDEISNAVLYLRADKVDKALGIHKFSDMKVGRFENELVCVLS